MTPMIEGFVNPDGAGKGNISVFAETFTNMQNSDNTKRAYRNDIKKWEQFLITNDGEETAETAVAFKRALASTYAPATAQRIFCTVSAFYGWMKGTDRIEITPFLGIKSPTRPSNEAPPVPSDDDVTELLIACSDGGTYGTKAMVVINLLLNGLRAQEVCDSKISNLKRDTQHQQWILNVLGKGSKWRAVPLMSGSQQAIFDFYFNYKNESDYLVPSSTDQGPMNVKAVWRMVNFFGNRAGLQNMHPHALRHHYATRLVRSGVDIFTLQKLLGHERADTTQRYVGLDYSDLSRALALDPLHFEFENHESLFGEEFYESAQ